jgi:mannose-6-phosphate isomerase-like protein (cupin superfamily)
MSAGKVAKVLNFSPGVILQVKVDESVPETSVDRYAAEIHCSEGDNVAEFYVPPHWHNNHTERMTVLEGRLEVVLEGKRIVIKAGDAPVIIPPRAVHSLRGFKGEKLVFQEQAFPGGRYKAEFFNDLLQEGKFGNPALALRAFYDNDTYLALPFYFRFVDQVFITIAGNIARLFAPNKPESLGI